MREMFRITKVLRKVNQFRTISGKSNYSDKNDRLIDDNPLKKTYNILRNVNQVRNVTKSFIKRCTDEVKVKKKDNICGDDFQRCCDVLIIGGGSVGASTAYWLKQKARNGLNVVVVERDPTYERASTVLSVGGLRQQFSLPENIQMSLYCAEFIRDVRHHLGDDVELNFTPFGYLVLASEVGAEELQKNSHLQNDLGAHNELLTSEQLKRKFPWINTEGIALGCHGLEREGWFDPWSLLMGFKRSARKYGAHFINGEVIGFEFQMQEHMYDQNTSEMDYKLPRKAIVKMANGEERTIQFALCVIAAGAYSAEVGAMAGIGSGTNIFAIPLPVEPRKRYVYVFNSQGINAPGLCTPLVVDPNGTYFRRDGLCGHYLCGRSPTPEQEPPIDNLDVDHGYFESNVWPTLAKRCPAFESIKVVNSWAGYYEYNVFDENGIIGYYPGYSNLLLATGFSGHGIQQTPAVGRAISELIIDSRFRTIDLTRLAFDRILVDQPMYESNIV